MRFEAPVLHPFEAAYADALAVLRMWVCPEPSLAGPQRAVREDFLTVLERGPAALDRAGGPAHLTASCLVIDPRSTSVLLTLHRKAGAWFQFGGHLDPDDPSVWGAATREAREESGLAALTPLTAPVHLDRHTLVGEFGACREHLDVRFVAVADLDAPVAVSAESHDVRWWLVDDLPTATRGELGPLIAAARAALSGGR